MTTASPTTSAPNLRAADSFTLDQFVARLGNVPLRRIRMHPAPGSARIEDVLENNDVRRETLCELVAGTLVEKAPMSYLDNRLTFLLAYYLQAYLRETRIGAGFTEGAMYQMRDGNIRLPDLSVTLKHRFPDGKVHRVTFARFAPDLAVEILSPSNTPEEIDLKRQELFASGSRLIWVANPENRTVAVHRLNGESVTLTEDADLSGEDVLPGFSLSIRQWFSEAEEV